MISDGVHEITEGVRREFGGLNDEQLNRKPAPDKWSIAQCLDHLVVSNETYFPAMESLLKGRRRKSFWQMFNPFTGIAGRRGLELLKAGKIKLKAPKIFQPSKSDEIKGSVEAFAIHQQKLGALADRLEAAGVLDEVISSPVTAMLTLKAGDAMNIMIEHEARHVKQAMNVKEVCIDEAGKKSEQ